MPAAKSLESLHIFADLSAPLLLADFISTEIVSTGSEVIKLFPCSFQLSTKFQLLIKTKIWTSEDFSSFKSLRYCIYHANKS